MELLQEEQQAWDQGLNFVAGVDEVGRGCLAGPVYAAAVILPREFDLPGLNDSKKLSAPQREVLSKQILDQALAVQIAWVDVVEIDRINIFHASLMAMAKALEKLNPVPQLVLVDGKFKAPVAFEQKTLIKGDARSASIAAASIVAKVARDHFMGEQDKVFPGYRFARHKGYGTAVHLKALQSLGPTPIHRLSFAPVKQAAASLKTA